MSANPHREVTDFLVLAVAVIFLFRAFVAEPFGIPTGSMGPTLLGRHKQCPCPHCGAPISVSTSEEIDLRSGSAASRLVSAQCGNCQASVDIHDQPSRYGDRIVVLKNPPGGYRRFQVIVFKNADAPRSYYVKRVVALPGETARIHAGEIEVREPSRGEWLLARKPAESVLAMAVPVYDDRFRPTDLPTMWPTRWTTLPDGAWTTVGPEYVLTGNQRGPSRLEYRHITRESFQPRLITDDMSYNSALSDTQAGNAWAYRVAGGHPIRDLLIHFMVGTGPFTEQFGAELGCGRDRFRFRWSKESGSYEILRNDQQLAAIPASPLSGRSRFSFANVDRQLFLWKDAKLLGSWPYEIGASDNELSADDLQPVALFGEGNGLRLSDLVLQRDIYYTRQSHGLDYLRPDDMADFLRDPARWGRLRDIRAQENPWKLASGQYVVLGDNSSRSNDSRHWKAGPVVNESMILGPALLLFGSDRAAGQRVR